MVDEPLEGYLAFLLNCSLGLFLDGCLSCPTKGTAASLTQKVDL